MKSFYVSTTIIFVFLQLSSSLLLKKTFRCSLLKCHMSGGRNELAKGDNVLPSSGLALFAVPVVWGTYSPLIKFIYSSGIAFPPPGSVFNLISYVFSFLSLQITLAVANSQSQSSTSSETTRRITEDEIRGGVELGLLLFAGSTIQIFGIQRTSAVDASVLIQLTTVLVPILESYSTGASPKAQLWISCVLALLGVIVLTVSDPLDAISRSNVFSSLSSGNALVIFAALLYSTHVVRLGKIAANCSPLNLALVKSATQLATSCIFVTFSYLTNSDGTMVYINSLQQTMTMAGGSFLPVMLAALWNGVIATALTTFAQSYGQKYVAPTQANLIYSSQPLWATAFACLGLGESLPDNAWVAGGLLAMSLLLALCR